MQPSRMGAIASVAAGPHGVPEGEHLVPEAVVDALVEVAWSAPGLRVSYARICPRAGLSYLASAGAEHLPDITGWTLDLKGASRLVEALRNADAPLAIEDVASDLRTRDIAQQLSAQSTGALLILALRSGRDPHPIGVVALDVDKPRTWNAKEAAALDRLGPLITLALEHGKVCEELAHAEARNEENERRLGGVRGLVSGVLHDTNVLVHGLMRTIATAMDDTAGRSASVLGRQLEGVLSELDTLNHAGGSVRPTQVFDLNTLIEDVIPGLRALVGPNVRMLARRHPEPLHIEGYQTGIERMLVNILVHANNSGRSVVLETGTTATMAQISLYGDGIQADELLCLLGDDTATPDQLGMGLWLARSEAMMHGATIDVADVLGGQGRVRIEFPLCRPGAATDSMLDR